MKQLFTILAILFTISFATLAQDGGGKQNGQKIEALKVAYITNKLNLSPEEAQKFWPVYNKYSDELRKVRQEGRQNKTPELEIEEKILAIRKKYNVEFSKVLTAEKVNAFFKAEKEFGTKLREEWMERRKQKQERKGQASE
ncbi:MAG: hypothetical protein J7578_21955 [Chitinophagaceae bacterium]|nr:hypothetical protein [Chitinophagaceae bacterium]